MNTAQSLSQLRKNLNEDIIGQIQSIKEQQGLVDTKIQTMDEQVAAKMEKKVKNLLKKLDENGKFIQSELQNGLKTQRQMMKDDTKKMKVDMVAKMTNIQLTLANLVQNEATKVESLVDGSQQLADLITKNQESIKKVKSMMSELDDKVEKKVIQPYKLKFDTSEKYIEMLQERMKSSYDTVEELKQKIKDLSEGKDIGEFEKVQEIEAMPTVQDLERKMTML